MFRMILAANVESTDDVNLVAIIIGWCAPINHSVVCRWRLQEPQHFSIHRIFLTLLWSL